MYIIIIQKKENLFLTYIQHKLFSYYIYSTYIFLYNCTIFSMKFSKLFSLDFLIL